MQCRVLYTGQPVLTTAVWPENNTLRIVHKSLADKYKIIQVTEFDELVSVGQGHKKNINISINKC